MKNQDKWSTNLLIDLLHNTCAILFLLETLIATLMLPETQQQM